MKWNRLTLVVFLVTASEVATQRKVASNFDILTDEVIFVPLENFLTGTNSLENAGTTQATINSDFEFHVDLTNDIQVEVNALMNIATVMPRMKRGVCSFIKIDTMIYPGIVKYGNMPRTCPISKGTYFVRGYKLNTELLPRTLPFGSYAINLTIFYENAKAVVGWKGRIVKKK